jgi:hypothetical protein
VGGDLRTSPDRLPVGAGGCRCSHRAQSLAVELAPYDTPAPSVGGDASAAAYQEYLKGRFHWNKPDDYRSNMCFIALEQALAAFTQAVTIDASFAPAHAMIARVHVRAR